jgi:hypothetical protein
MWDNSNERPTLQHYHTIKYLLLILTTYYLLLILLTTYYLGYMPIIYYLAYLINKLFSLHLINKLFNIVNSSDGDFIGVRPSHVHKFLNAKLDNHTPLFI